MRCHNTPLLFWYGRIGGFDFTIQTIEFLNVSRLIGFKERLRFRIKLDQCITNIADIQLHILNILKCVRVNRAMSTLAGFNGLNAFGCDNNLPFVALRLDKPLRPRIKTQAIHHNQISIFHTDGIFWTGRKTVGILIGTH